jgi:hypothetical protein
MKKEIGAEQAREHEHRDEDILAVVHILRKMARVFSHMIAA